MKKLIQLLFLLTMAVACLLGCSKAPLLPVDHSVTFEESKTEREWMPTTIHEVSVTYPAGIHFTVASLFASQPIDFFSYDLMFDSSAIYQTKNPDNQGDYNKAGGIKAGIDGRNMSAQVGWSYDLENGRIRIAPYIQKDKYRFYTTPQQLALSFQIAEKIHIELRNYETYFYLIIGDYQYLIKKSDFGIKDFKQGYLIGLVAGGQEAFDHDVKIHFL